jgi:hypothetical protein
MQVTVSATTSRRRLQATTCLDAANCFTGTITSATGAPVAQPTLQREWVAECTCRGAPR